MHKDEAFLECRNCNGTNVKFHEYTSFSYYYCSDCKGEVNVNHHIKRTIKLPGSIDFIPISVGIDFAAGIEPSPPLPVGVCSDSSDASRQSQLSIGSLGDLRSCRSEQAPKDDTDVETNQDVHVDGDIPAIADHLSQLLSTPKGHLPMRPDFGVPVTEDSLTDRLWHYLPVGSSKK